MLDRAASRESGGTVFGYWVRDPERYGNIAVRVAGYSQMFKLVNKELQDHIIARTKHRR